jgi:hypothetical protein
LRCQAYRWLTSVRHVAYRRLPSDANSSDAGLHSLGNWELLSFSAMHCVAEELSPIQSAEAPTSVGNAGQTAAAATFRCAIVSPTYCGVAPVWDQEQRTSFGKAPGVCTWME